jgi:acetyl-CoA acyltransferase
MRRMFSSVNPGQKMRGGGSTKGQKNIVVVDGVRMPFAMQSTKYNDYLAVDLSRLAMKGLLTKTALDPSLIDYVEWGTVIMETKTSNIAREASMGAGIPLDVPSHTVTQACISSSVAVCSAAEKIMAGQADVVLCGGVETFSDVPIRFQRPVRQRMIAAPKAMKKGFGGVQKLLKGLKMSDLAPEAPAIANYTTGEVMGVSSDRLSAKFGVSREEMDRLAVLSHQTAAKAHAEGFYKGEVLEFKGSSEENGIKGDSSYEKVSKLKPAFIKPHGTHTAGNSSFLTDGASASLIMSEDRALELGFKPLAYIRDWAFVACDPFEELLLGPTYGAHKCLTSMGLTMKDIGVFEIHEAFAGQVLANLTAMNSQAFADEKLGGKVVGEVDQSKMNTKGGSLALGHPFGATGSRLVTTAARRLQAEGERFAMLAACADGGLGHCAILERYDNK